MDWSTFGTRVVWGNPLAAWALALLLTASVFGVLKVLHWGLSKYLTRVASRTHTRVDDGVARVIKRTKAFFFLVVASYWGTRVLELSPQVEKTLAHIASLAVLVQAGLWASSSVRVTAELLSESNESGAADAARATFAAGFRFLSNLVIWSLVVIFALSNVGVEVSALLAGLGVGGIAVALAAQNVLGDLFASIAIYVDRPFDLGDWVRVDGLIGTVDHVGMRSSRVRASTGELVIVPNRKLIESRIENLRRRGPRLVIAVLAVEYGTPLATLESIPSLVQRVVESVERGKFERCVLRNFADSSLEFEAVFWANSAELDEQMAIIHRVNVGILRAFHEAGVSFAFPSRTVHVRRDGDPAAA